MNWSPVLTFIIFRSHLMEVERNQFSLLLREAYSCLSMCICVVRGWAGALFSLFFPSWLFLSLHPPTPPHQHPHPSTTLYLSIMYDSRLFATVFIFHSYSSPSDYPSAYQRFLMKIHNIFLSRLIPYQRRNLVPENQFSFILLSPPLLHLHAWFLSV